MTDYLKNSLEYKAVFMKNSLSDMLNVEVIVFGQKS